MAWRNRDDGGGAAGGSNNKKSDFNPPPDLLDRRAQTKYRIQHELGAVSRRMDQNALDNATRQATERERERLRGQNLLSAESRAIEAGERERARLVAEERDRLLARGQLNVRTRDRYNPSLEERNIETRWRQMDEQQQRRMLELDRQAAELTKRELGPRYRLSPEVLNMSFPKFPPRSPEIRRRQN